MDSKAEMARAISGLYKLNDPKVLAAMMDVPRECFVARTHRKTAYSDNALPIGYGQTISQPYTVAFMTKLLIENPISRKASRGKILEIGTGSGYQAAILSKLFRKVYTVEIIRQLANRAKKVLKKLGYNNVFVKIGSGEWGWKEKSPFDAIIVTADLKSEVPDELLNQLKIGGVLVAPVKGEMMRFTKLKNLRTEGPKNRKTEKLKTEKFGRFDFVPFVDN